MFNPFKKKDKPESGSNSPTEFEKAPDVARQEKDLISLPELQEIRTMPEKFLRKAPKSREKKLSWTAGIIIFLIILILGLSALLLFSEQLLFGKKELSPEISSSPILTSKITETSTTTERTEGSAEPVETTLIQAEAKNSFAEVIGRISLEVPVSNEAMDLKVWAIDDPPLVLGDKQGQEFRVLAGAYAWYPPGNRLATGELSLMLTYRKEDLSPTIEPDEIRVAIWQRESEATVYFGTTDPDTSSVMVLLETVPEGNIALVVPLGKQKESPTVIAIPLASDKDNDGLTDKEEKTYMTLSDNPDTDGDGYPDGLELLNLYNPKGFGRLATSGLVQVYTNDSYSYSIFYPRLWSIAASQDEAGKLGRKVIFFAPTSEEFIEVRVEDNPASLQALAWYLDQSPAVAASDLSVATIAGLEAVWSLDRFSIYIAKGNLIYLLTYNIGIQEKAGFRTTFEMMMKSLSIAPEENLVYRNEIQSFSLELPPTWQDYEVATTTVSWGSAGTSTGLVFKLPTNDSQVCLPLNYCDLFTLHIFDYSVWSQVQKRAGTVPVLIDVSGEYVFAYTEGASTPSDLAERLREVPEIMSSFSFTSNQPG